MKFLTVIQKVLIEGSVSQIFSIGLSLFYVKKRVTFWLTYLFFYVLFFKNTTKKYIKILRHASLH